MRKNGSDSSRSKIVSKDEIRCGDLTNIAISSHRSFFMPEQIGQATDIHDRRKRKASGTDAQPGYEVAVLSGDWGRFTNKYFRAGITWALLARL